VSHSLLVSCLLLLLALGFLLVARSRSSSLRNWFWFGFGLGFALQSVELALAATLICSVDLVGMVLLTPGCSLDAFAGTSVLLHGSVLSGFWVLSSSSAD